jgi:hypothetical protein
VTKILCFSGKIGSGKSTLAVFVENNFHHLFDPGRFQTCKRFAFAGLLKELCVSVLGLSRADVYGDQAAKARPTGYRWKDLPHFRPALLPPARHEADHLSVREVLQQVGSMFRTMDSHCWANACVRACFDSRVDLAVLDDCRYPEEVQAVHRHGGVVVRLLRSAEYHNHESETALDGPTQSFFLDYVLDNRFQSLADTRRALVREVLDDLGWSRELAHVPCDDELRPGGGPDPGAGGGAGGAELG